MKYEDLYREFVDAFLSDEDQMVRTPGWIDPVSPVIEVIRDDFYGHDNSLGGLLRLVAKAAQSQPEFSEWVQNAASRHAAFHADHSE